ncbi:tRNA1(Val) (adenine(37)-N6)-methyltransferase [Sarcina ventriculi]|uniref:tRNA1(Val) (adenine(37)-N6)-methyltransferase n=1 Tax=Sarcina ventriculi TaxID=1267 RepID=UPI0018ABF175|nr:tRNA1(Val) (adenine(37)-N6)-methyltransferase [Sarcina ventriculi]
MRDLDLSLVKDGETLDDLQLKDICIIQKREGFRFGIDAVLLANFANVKKRHKVMDLCTGTGIVPFIIKGKKEPEKIVGLEIQNKFVEMANRSIKINGFNDTMEFLHGDLKDKELLKSIGRFDVVTVNPPYKLEKSGIVNPNDKYAIARHEVMCNLDNVIEACRIVLKDNGRLYMVHRPERLADIFCIMRKYKIEPKRVQMVHPNTKKPANILLVEGQRDGGAYLKWEPPIYVYNDDGSFSKEINEIYGRI